MSNVSYQGVNTEKYKEFIIMFNVWSRGRKEMRSGVFKELQKKFISKIKKKNAPIELTSAEFYDCEYSKDGHDFKNFLLVLV